MKNLLFYTDTAQIGGAELQMFLLSKFLNKEEFKVILACSNHRKLDEWCEKFKNEATEVIRLKVAHKHDPRHLGQIKKIIREKSIDLIHSHVWNPASCRYSFMAASSTKTPIIITEHDPFKLSKIKDFFKKSALKKVQKIITVSEENKRTILELYPDYKNKISVIHNGIDTTWWQSQLLRFTKEDKEKIKTKIFHANKDTFIITTVAELHERKGLQYLIKAIKPVSEKYPNIKLVIIGDGKERQNLRKLIKKLKLSKNVTLAGRQKQIPKLLKSSNIFALPSLREAFGFVNLEAMICELPVVASHVGGIPEIVDKHSGILIKPANPEEISKAITLLIEHQEIREKMGESGKARVLQNFTAGKMAKRYQEIYEDILS
jgi:glycosyltransferase involved in cell wall biosynthesis